MVGVYIPQFLKIMELKNSRGFNTWFMFLGHTGAYLSCLNALIFYINNWWTCSNTLNCTEKFLGFGLIIVQWFLYWILYFLFVKYHPKPDKSNLEYVTRYKWFYRRGFPYWSFIFSNIICVVFTIITLIVLDLHGWKNAQTSDINVLIIIMQVVITSMFLIHYIPQIWETYKLKQAGSLSLITLGLMAPGTFLWTIFLATQKYLVPNSKGESSPFVWVPYLIVGIFQAILLGMGIYYERQRKKKSGPYSILISDPSTDDDYFGP